VENHAASGRPVARAIQRLGDDGARRAAVGLDQLTRQSV